MASVASVNRREGRGFHNVGIEPVANESRRYRHDGTGLAILSLYSLVFGRCDGRFAMSATITTVAMGVLYRMPLLREQLDRREAHRQTQRRLNSLCNARVLLGFGVELLDYHLLDLPG